MRLFVAIELDAAAHAWCDRWRDAVIHAQPEARRALRWVDRRARHVTMKFIGEVEPARAVAIAAAVSAMHLAMVEPVVAAGLRWLPHVRRARVLAVDLVAARASAVRAGDAGEEHPLAAIHRQLEAVLVPFGVPGDQRAFTPHITLARTRRDGSTPWAAAASAAAEARVTGSPPGVAAGVLTLFESRLMPEGPEYRRLAMTCREEGV